MHMNHSPMPKATHFKVSPTSSATLASAVVESTYGKLKIYPHKVCTRKIPLQQFCLSDGHVSSKTLTNKLRAIVEVVCSGSIFLFTILSILH